MPDFRRWEPSVILREAGAQAWIAGQSGFQGVRLASGTESLLPGMQCGGDEFGLAGAIWRGWAGRHEVWITRCGFRRRGNKGMAYRRLQRVPRAMDGPDDVRGAGAAPIVTQGPGARNGRARAANGRRGT